MEDNNSLDQKASNENEKPQTEISKRHWPWIVAGLVGMVLIEHSDLKDERAKKDTLYETSIKNQQEITRMAIELSEGFKDLKNESENTIHRNDSLVVLLSKYAGKPGKPK